MPRPDFPKTLAEFQERFATEDACRRYLVESRWPNGYRCPRCEHAEAYPVRRRTLLQCRACRYQASVTARTVMHRTRMLLRDWFWAAYLVTTHTPGFSAWPLQRQLGRRDWSRTRRPRPWPGARAGRRAGRRAGLAGVSLPDGQGKNSVATTSHQDAP